MRECLLNRQLRKRNAMTLCQTGLVAIGLAWPLGNTYHPAVQLAVTLLGAVMVVSGTVMLFRLLSEQEKEIEELQNQLKTTEPDAKQ